MHAQIYPYAVLPFRLDGEFEAPSESLTKLEAMGLKVLTAMATVDPATLNAVFKDRPSTWRTLLDVLEEINCDELSKKVEAFLTAPGTYKSISIRHTVQSLE